MKYVIRVPEGVQNEQAYIKAAEGRIAANAAKSARAKWRIQHADAERLEDFIFQTGEFEDRADITGGLFAGDWGNVFLSFRDQLLDRGSLSVKQTEIVRNTLNKRIQWAAERAEKRANEAAKSDHVGALGERRNFDLTCIFVTSYESRYGVQHIHGFKDDFGNIIIHKGNPIWVEVEVDTRDRRISKGDRVSLTASIKSHGEREGVKQTIITRPSKADLRG